MKGRKTKRESRDTEIRAKLAEWMQTPQSSHLSLRALAREPYILGKLRDLGELCDFGGCRIGGRCAAVEFGSIDRIRLLLGGVGSYLQSNL